MGELPSRSDADAREDDAMEDIAPAIAISTNSLACDFSPPLISSLIQNDTTQRSSQLADFDLQPPDVVSIAIHPPKIRTTGFLVSSSGDSLLAKREPTVAAEGTQSRLQDAKQKSRRATGRISPPQDFIKLEDRLLCVLEPPVETWMRRSEFAFAQQPFPHQWDGVAFLFPRRQAILADEMGLGKTMQAITAIRLLLLTGKLRRVLLICPKPLVTNWQREFAHWAAEIPVAVVEGSAHRRAWRWNAELPVKIANYELLHRDSASLSGAREPFDLVVLDEAQRIKNRRSSISKLVRDIPRRRSWALTGTPVENSPSDLVGIFEFLSPGYLHEEMQLSRLGSLASDHVLRRTKSGVQINLPPRLFRDLELPLSPEQDETYHKAEEDGTLRLTEMGDEITIQHVFELVIRLKQICNFDPATGASCKLERLQADLEEIAGSGQKAIIFSQWVETLQRLSRELQAFNPLEYHGRIPTKRRDDILNQFREDPKCHVLLMSYGAGGVGLNLQFAQYVFLFDRWWNPAVEDQAINRAHRIGAKSPVTVGRFLTLGTIEERIDEILRQKRDMFDAVLSHTRGCEDLALSREEIMGLFAIKPNKRRDAA